MSSLVIVTQPSIEPVEAIDVWHWLRVDNDIANEDASIITGLIRSARMKAELYTWRAFITQRLRWSADEWPDDGIINLPRPQLQLGDDTIANSQVVVEYKDDDGDLIEVDADDYWIDTDSEPGRLWPVSSWPSHAAAPGAVRVTYSAGYGDTRDSVPELIKTAIKKTVATWFEYRQDMVDGATLELPQTARMDLDFFRLMEFR